MQQVKGLYRVSRPITTLSGALAVVLGGYDAGTGEWLKVAIAVLVTILISSSANAWNDYLDIEIDRVNQPHRPLPAGEVSPELVKRFSFGLAILSILIAALINPAAFLIAVAANLLLFFYSFSKRIASFGIEIKTLSFFAKS